MNEPRIAVVDDDAAVAHSIVALLNSDGFEALAYRSAEAFFASCTHETYCCLLADWRLSGIGIIELCQRVSVEAGHLPIIFMTDPPSGLAPTRLNPDIEIEFVGKPFDPERILAEIRRRC